MEPISDFYMVTIKKFHTIVYETYPPCKKKIYIDETAYFSIFIIKNKIIRHTIHLYHTSKFLIANLTQYRNAQHSTTYTTHRKHTDMPRALPTSNVHSR